MTNKSMNQIKLFGFCDRKFVAHKIDECAFACIPSYFENFSMVPLEIMARTRCLIFTERTSGNEVIINNEDGYIVSNYTLKPGFTKIHTVKMWYKLDVDHTIAVDTIDYSLELVRE